MADGVIEAHTAAMLQPYANRGSTGEPAFTADELSRIVALLDKGGWQVFIHAIGDAAVRSALDAFEHAGAVNRPPARGRRHRIEHIETIDPADVPRFGSLGVVASLQPFHGSPSPSQLEVWTANIGPARAARGWSYGSIHAAGGRLAFGSDWPVVTLDPRFGLHTAVTRTTPEGLPESGWYADERVPLATAIDAYTSASAWASFDEQRKGTISRDMLADLVILSSDVFAPGARLLDATVETTIFDGKVVYTRDPDVELTHN
jgi:hypothetical protein